jgi:outer membrane protein insertion porin family
VGRRGEAPLVPPYIPLNVKRALALPEMPIRLVVLFRIDYQSRRAGGAVRGRGISGASVSHLTRSHSSDSTRRFLVIPRWNPHEETRSMQHATCDRAIRHWLLPRALLLGFGLLILNHPAWGQLPSTDFGPRMGDAPDAGGGIAIPSRTKPARMAPEAPESRRSLESFDPQEKAAETPFTLDEPMAAVKIEGNTTIPNGEIAKHIKTRPGRTVTARQIKDDVDALVRTRWFATVEPSIRRTDDGNVLVFRVLERPIVRKVEYKGNKKIKTKDFDRMTQLKPGQPYDVSVNKECARRILQHYHEKGFAFATVELERGDVRSDPDREVVFLINEGPKVKVTSVQFDGNDTFYDPLLKTKTRSKTRILWLFGGKYDPSTINDDIEGVRNYYYSLGYFDVQITPEQKFADDKSTVELHYHIQEGQRYRINEISVVGNEVLSEEDILKLMKVQPGEEYNERNIAKDVDAIMAKYGEQGRLFAQVAPIRRWSEEPGVLDLVYRINEDKVYRIRNIGVHIAGDYPHTRTNLIRNIATIQPGDLADPKKIQMFKQRLAGSGYFDTDGGGPRIETNPVKNKTWVAATPMDVARGQSDLPFGRNDLPIGQNDLLSPLTDLPIGHTVSRPSTPATKVAATRPVDGGQRKAPPVTSNKTSEPEDDPYLLKYEPVDPDPVPADDNARLLPITPLFRAQSRDPLRPPENAIYDVSPQGDPFGKAIQNPDPYDDLNRLPPPEFIDIDTYLSEARTGRLMFGVGVNSNSGLVGNIVLSEQNFDIRRPPTSWDDLWNGTAWRGAGEKFRIEAMPGTQFSRYLVDWTNPYFMDTNNSLGVSGFYFNRYYQNWTEQRLGGRVRVGRQFTQQWSGSTALRLERVDVFNPSTANPPQLLKDALGTNLLSTVMFNIAHDTRDSPFMPSQGHHAEVNFEQAFGQYDYSRVNVEGRQYFTMYQRADGGGKHILSVRGEVGWTGNSTPIFERFFAGGLQSFRGFYFRSVSPKQNGVYVGGDWMMLGSVEYMLPVMANEMVRVVTFSDFGTVTDRVSLSDFRVSVGAGLRITVPMLGPTPLALDWAVPLVKDPNDRTQLFSFFMGLNR